MAQPTLPADGDNPWGAVLRSALVDISNRADQGITSAQSAQAELDGVSANVNTNNTTLTSYGTRITNLETSVATKAADSAVVKLAGNQTIADTKTFTAAPVVPDNSFNISAINGLQTALNAKASLASPVFTGTVGGLDKTMVGLANVDNTTDLLKPVSTATQNALNLKANSTDLTSAIQTHNHTGGTSGVNIPVAAVSGLQDALNAKQGIVHSTATGAAAVTVNSTAFTLQYLTLYRFGPIAYIYVWAVSKKVISGVANGNIDNVLIATINSSSEFSHIYNNSNGTITYGLSTADAGVGMTGFVEPATGKIWLSTTNPNQDIGVGQIVNLTGTFILDNSTG